MEGIFDQLSRIVVDRFTVHASIYEWMDAEFFCSSDLAACTWQPVCCRPLYMTNGGCCVVLLLSFSSSLFFSYTQEYTSTGNSTKVLPDFDNWTLVKQGTA
jgi:hypothetical protein